MIKHSPLYSLWLLFLFISAYSFSAEPTHFPEYRFHTMVETSFYGGIQSIVKDGQGRIWFSGENALFMFDGKEFVRRDLELHNSYGNRELIIGKITLDTSGDLIIASNAGLMKYLFNDNRFVCALDGKIKSLEKNSDGIIWFIRNGTVGSLDKDGTFRTWPFGDKVIVSSKQVVLTCSNNKVYIGSGNQLYMLNQTTGEYELLKIIDVPECLIEDVIEHNGNLYVLTFMHGLYEYDSELKDRNHYYLSDRYDGFTAMKELYLDESGFIWALSQSGILVINPNTGDSKLIQSDLNDPHSLPNNSVWTVYDDSDAGKWIGTYGGKLAYVSPYDNGVFSVKASPGGLNHPIVSCFLDDSDGNLWIGTEGGGINLLDKKTRSYTYFTADNDSGLSSNNIKRLRWSPDSTIIAATFNGGIKRFNKKTRRFEPLGNGFPKTVYDFEYEGKSSLWMANPMKELFFADLEKGSVTKITPLDEHGAPVSVNIETLFHDWNGNLCLVTHDGLYVMDSKSAKILNHYHHENDYSSNNFCCHYLDKDGNVWLGSRGGGISILKTDGSFTWFHDVNHSSLMGKHVYSILDDPSCDRIWFSTDEGLFFLNGADNTLYPSRIAGKDTGSPNGAQYIRSSHRTRSGELVFGGTDGYFIFSPNKRKTNQQKPVPYLVGLKVNNSPMAFNADKTLVLTHLQANLEVAFSSNSYLHAEKNQFAYRVLGGNSDMWSILPAGQRAVQLFGLSPGNYRFEIKAANNDGLWGDQIASFRFRIKPSPFLSWWAFLIYLTLLTGIALVGVYIKHNYEQLTLQIKELYRKKYIAGPSEIIVTSQDDEIMKKAMTLIERNMDNASYNVDAFVRDMGIGRSVLYQKIAELTGMSIKEFILDIRMKRAASLLKDTELNVAEISYMVGFNNPKYFSTCFKRVFGMTPSAYKDKN